MAIAQLLERTPRLRVLDGGRDAPPVAAAGRRATSLEDLGRKDARRLELLAVSLTVFGLVSVAGVSPIESLYSYGSVFSLVERQVMWALIGLVAFVVARRQNLARLRRRVRPILVAAFCLLLAVLVPHLGKGAGGSSRWLGAGPITLQPSEIAKLAFALFAADLVARRERCRDQLHELVLPLALIAAILGALILKQPDLGTAIVVVGIAATLWYAGGVRGRLLASVVGVLAVLGSILALAAPYRRARLLAFLNPFGHASTVGYQLVQSLAALGSGHLAGHPMATAVSPWLLPNASSDFIFAAIGNDFGLLGCLAVVCGFACFGWLGIRIAMRAEDRYRALLATAITGWIVFQAFVNMGGVTGLLPDTGIPLPFLSAGGSSLIVALFACGLLANIARQPKVSTELVTAPARPASGTRTRPRADATRSRQPSAPSHAPRSATRRPAERAPRAAASARTPSPRRAGGSRQAATVRRPASAAARHAAVPLRAGAPRRAGVMTGSRAGLR
ncbi:MAG: putative peptidoglycan glycosyltransferase FtsW [Actinomycetota bacterium]|nr:putative peptidoglycan glycosyltransferase FtsW [Actinomycetota bacterium]